MENGDALYQKFMSSKQAPVRLELALSGFFQPDGYTDKQHRDFGDYLRLRIRPAAEALIQRDALDKLQVLEELGWMDASVIGLYGLCHPESENTGVYLAAGTENPEVWVS